jgi:hypothetical protein
MRVKIENDRRVFLTEVAQMKQEMILGVDKNVYVEPAIWTIESKTEASFQNGMPVVAATSGQHSRFRIFLLAP